MHDDLQNIKDAVEAQDFALARSLSDSFVTENDSLFTDMKPKADFELVAAVDVFRSAGMEENQWQVEAWLLHHFEPQNIGGSAQAIVRVV